MPAANAVVAMVPLSPNGHRRRDRRLKTADADGGISRSHARTRHYHRRRRRRTPHRGLAGLRRPSWLPDGCSQIFRSYVFGPSGFWPMAPLRYAAKFDPFLSLDCAPTPSTLAQSKERKGSNVAIWQPWSPSSVRVFRPSDRRKEMPGKEGGGGGGWIELSE